MPKCKNMLTMSELQNTYLHLPTTITTSLGPRTQYDIQYLTKSIFMTIKSEPNSLMNRKRPCHRSKANQLFELKYFHFTLLSNYQQMEKMKEKHFLFLRLKVFENIYWSFLYPLTCSLNYLLALKLANNRKNFKIDSFR